MIRVSLAFVYQQLTFGITKSDDMIKMEIKLFDEIQIDWIRISMNEWNEWFLFSSIYYEMTEKGM